MNKIANLSDNDRRDLFRETASKMHTTNAIVEKDFWVVWVLDKLFKEEKLREILMFKGGTSLSKIFGLIERFSEDIDLILNWNLLTNEDPYEDRSKTQQSKFNKSINDKAKEYIKDVLLPIVSEILKPHCNCKIKENDGCSIDIQYPALFSDSAILPHILLEIGPLALWVPSAEFEITPFAAKKFPEMFEQSTCKVNAILAERTFWEKATILHQEANRVKDKNIPSRHSRHYYDLAMMAVSDVKVKALADLELLKGVVEFKQKFYTSGWAKYDEAKPGTFKLLPPDYRHKELKEDYKAMQNMIFGKRIDIEEMNNFEKVQLKNEITLLTAEAALNTADSLLNYPLKNIYGITAGIINSAWSASESFKINLPQSFELERNIAGKQVFYFEEGHITDKGISTKFHRLEIENTLYFQQENFFEDHSLTSAEINFLQYHLYADRERYEKDIDYQFTFDRYFSNGTIGLQHSREEIGESRNGIILNYDNWNSNAVWQQTEENNDYYFSISKQGKRFSGNLIGDFNQENGLQNFSFTNSYLISKNLLFNSGFRKLNMNNEKTESYNSKIYYYLNNFSGLLSSNKNSLQKHRFN